jgi:RNA polymerase sigma-70 factor (sigma-E family)
MVARADRRLWEADTVEADPDERALVDVTLAPAAASVDALLTELHRRHYRALVGLARLVVDRPVEAEEIVQEAFVRLYASWNGLRDADRALAYLRATVLNLGRSGIRRRIVARRYLSTQQVAEASSPGADEALAAGTGVDPALRAMVLGAVRSLPRRQRECVLLRYYEGLGEHDVAVTLGISAGSVKTHTHRAMAALAAKLAGRTKDLR